MDSGNHTAALGGHPAAKAGAHGLPSPKHRSHWRSFKVFTCFTGSFPSFMACLLEGIFMKNLSRRILLLAALALGLELAVTPSAIAGSFSDTGAMNIARGNGHTASLLANGKVLVTGGHDNDAGGFLSSAELYDPAAGTWAVTGTMSIPRYEHTATLLASGKVLVAGGYSGNNNYLTSAELYDSATGTWTASGAMNIPRYNHTATLLANGKVLVAGGNTGNGQTTSAELYDPATGTWTVTGALGTARLYHTATLLPNGKVLVAGGYIGIDNYISSAELYDPAAGTWTVTYAMLVGRVGHSATLLPNGKVLVAGGSTGNNNYLAGAELYDPATGTWSATGAMISARVNYMNAPILPNGKVLVAGGSNDNGLTSSAELYDPATGTWAATGSLGTLHSSYSVTLLANGKVLVAGGYSSTGSTALAIAEIYSSTCELNLNAAVHGGITGNASPYFTNTTATLTATPSPGYIFTGWAGDATGTENPLSVLMDADKTITATFGPDTNDDDEDGLTNYREIVELGTRPDLPDTDGDTVDDGEDALPLDPTETLDTDGDGTGDNADTDDDGDGYTDEDEINIHGTNPKRADSDGDGLSDPTELQTHLTNPNLADSDSDGLSDGAEVNTHGTLPKVADTDGDGFLDGYEVLTGKSPLNDQDKPALVAEARTAIEFTFPSALGKTYRIEDSFDLQTWDTVESGIAGNGGQIQRFYATRGMPMRYFRVEEVAP
jgi:uncharacterized repeat protein (TIGR02543 family)